MTQIDDQTLQAYRDTDYAVFATPPFALHIGVASEPLRGLYRLHGVECCAFVTACNPRSLPLPEDENAARQRALAEELERSGYSLLDGEGRHPDGGWSEPSLLVLGISADDALALGARHGQNAIVWCGADAIPRLLLLR